MPRSVAQQTARTARPKLHVTLASSPSEILAAQKLRWRVFADELGARLPSRTPGVDRDLYDPYCDHLIVRDEANGRIVGSYRILSPAAARKVGGYYSETEFDLTRITHLRSRFVEIGRSCIDPDYRTGATIALLWSGLARYMQQNGYAYPWVSLGLRRALKKRWSRQLLDTLGIHCKKVGAGGTACIPPGMLVANHVSWLDIFVINALAPAAFVSKDEVRHWPLIGWFCRKTETIFLERGSRAAAQRTRETMIRHLQAGTHVAVFPEGTTTAGDRVLPFHAALLQSAVDAGTPIVPLTLRYVDPTGNVSRAPAYDGDVSLLQCLLAIVRSGGGLTAEVRILAPLDSAQADRRHLAARCHHAIAWHLGHADPPEEKTIPSPSVAPTGHRASEIPGDPQAAAP